jgi:hypothetical protein
VRGLIDLHGGSMEVSSQVGQGTRFTVRLPCNCKTARPVAKPSIARPSNVERLAPDRATGAPEIPLKKTA